jgi:hypothetical protein
VGANYDLYVLGPKQRLARRAGKHRRHLRTRRRVVARGASIGSQEQIDMSVCGQTSVTVEVRRRTGTGPFTVSVTHP